MSVDAGEHKGRVVCVRRESDKCQVNRRVLLNRDGRSGSFCTTKYDPNAPGAGWQAVCRRQETATMPERETGPEWLERPTFASQSQ